MAQVPEKPRKCLSIDDIQVGQKFEKEYAVSYETVKKFAEISGDWNPVHHDPEYAETTIFKKQIAHGMISVAQFSGIFGMDLPGLGAVWTRQDTTFLKPVYLDQPYKAVVEVKEIQGRRVVFTVWTENADGEKVLEGEGELMPIPAKVKDKTDLTNLLA